MNNFAITCVVCSRHTDKEKEKFLNNLKDTCNWALNINFIVNTEGVSLTKIYHEMIEKCQTDIIVFCHDDIEFLKKGWGQEIVNLFQKNKEYGIIGVAGSAEFDKNAAWWNYNEKYGQVLHRSNGKSWLSAFSPLLKEDLKEVCVIDGLFMAIHTKRISKNFNEEFSGFNHYDTSMCISNYIDGKCKIGVTTNLRIAHNSIGETKPNWFENKDLLNEKYGKYFPLNVNNDKRRRNSDNTLKENG